MKKVTVSELFKKIGIPLSVSVSAIATLLLGNVTSDERASHSIFTVASADVLEPDSGAGGTSDASMGSGTSSASCSASAGTAGTDAGAAGEGDGCSCGGSGGSGGK